MWYFGKNKLENKMKKLFILLTIPFISFADVEFILSGTANGNSFGYTAGQSYSFSFIVNDNYSGGSGDFFSDTGGAGLSWPDWPDSDLAMINEWSQTTSSDDQIFNNISSDTFSGSYNPIFVQETEPETNYGWGGHYELSIVEEDGFQELWLTVDNGTEGSNPADDFNIGLYMPDGTGIDDFAVEIVLEDFVIPYSDSFTSPTDIWIPHIGTYAISHPNSWFDLEVYSAPGGESGYIEFTPTSLTIIPEPSTIGLIGIASTGLVLLRNNKNKLS